ncbi:hypothetical protein ACSVIJ_16190 [Pseudomonas sp. NCHU5208]|uniref:hypothetical protein n=1 Tax=unclassified Pseudomonas TaxID=196821 RepID=UPI003F99B466
MLKAIDFSALKIKENGNLVFEGQDLGDGVEGAFGCSEYEWYWTIKKQDIPRFKEAIGGNGNILNLLGEKFSNDKAANLYEFMQNHNIPFESWSRIGD